MKKILIGLAAVSIMSFAAAPTLTSDPTENTTVFQTEQLGEIAVKGNLSSQVPEVKYVVYASTTGQYDPDGDTIKLPPFIISNSVVDASKVGFAGETTPTVYVKKVNSSNDGVIDLDSTEKVYVKLVLDQSWGTFTSSLVTTWTNSITYDFTPFLFFTKAEFESLVATAGENISVRVVNTTNLNRIGIDFSGNVYLSVARVQLRINNNKVAFGTVANILSENGASSANAKVIETLFATERPYAGALALAVKVQTN